jgi:predicted phosphate transport protein (TIGR00153 family)
LFGVTAVLFGGSKDKQFFTLLQNATKNVVEGSRLFSKLVETADYTHVTALKELETKGDSITHEAISLLNKAFTTPIDREDILALAVRIDDLIDGLEAAGARMKLYKIAAGDRFMREFSRLIEAQVAELVQAMEQMAGKSIVTARPHCVEINMLENQADTVLREALEQLFDHETDAIRIIKYKELYETLEEITDVAEDVANLVESVVMKHS